MRVFISWSGDVSRSLAVAMQQWLPMAVQHVDAWISDRDIRPGERWALVLGRALEESDFGVICLTADNLKSPWILFEAGAMARSRDAKVVPVLYDLERSALPEPLAQFQSVSVDRIGIHSLVMRLFEVAGSSLDVRQRDGVFNAMWPVLEPQISDLSRQVHKRVLVESGTDLVNSLTKSVEQGTDVVRLDWEKLGRLHNELSRLRGTLDHLNREEARRLPDEVPAGLVSAIESTDWRLRLTEATVRQVLDRIFSSLTASQIAVLRSLITSDGLRITRTLKDYPGKSKDLRELEVLGLLATNPDSTVVAHELVADYVHTRSGAG